VDQLGCVHGDFAFGRVKREGYAVEPVAVYR
jgi:hypothetical protein